MRHKNSFYSLRFYCPQALFLRSPSPDFPSALEQPLLLLLLLRGNCSKCRLLRIRRMGLMHMQTPQNVAKSSGRTSACVALCVVCRVPLISALWAWMASIPVPSLPCPASASLVSRSRFGSKGAIIVLKHLDKVKRTHIQHTHTHVADMCWYWCCCRTCYSNWNYEGWQGGGRASLLCHFIAHEPWKLFSFPIIIFMCIHCLIPLPLPTTLEAGRGAEPVGSNHAWFYSRNAESAEITSAFNVLD